MQQNYFYLGFWLLSEQNLAIARKMFAGVWGMQPGQSAALTLMLTDY